MNPVRSRDRSKLYEKNFNKQSNIIT